MHNLYMVSILLFFSQAILAGNTLDIKPMNILCNSNLDAVCKKLKGAKSYSSDFQCDDKIFEREANTWELTKYYIKDLATQVDDIPGEKKEFFRFIILSSSEKGYAVMKILKNSYKYNDHIISILSTIDCE